jgi:hypothetical protein
MPTATTTNNTPARRSAMQFGLAALAAGVAVRALADADTVDAELLTLCAELHREHAIVLPVTVYPEDTARTEAQRRRWGISGQIQSISGQTGSGRIAKAAVALALIRENRTLDRMDDDMSMAFWAPALGNVAGSAAA